ncbi:MAG: glycosyltransferase [Nocardioidaceae bacterium]|nr:glycosyltransferase [Nocardioidaceae bacterium]
MTDVSIVIISKDERFLDDTLRDLSTHESRYTHEVVVVDASDGRLGDLAAAYPDVRWVHFEKSPTSEKTITIPEQRNMGIQQAKSDVVVFTDSGCRPQPGWLDALAAPLIDRTEMVTVGSYQSLTPSPYNRIQFDGGPVREAPTLNFAFRREVVDRIGWFDEDFSYCSDADFCWRVNDAGMRVMSIPEALVLVDWERGKRQNRRSRRYGAGRARLYAKHPRRMRTVLKNDPIMVVYPIFLLGLPLTLLFPVYPLLLLVPLWRARGDHPVGIVIDHLHYGAGVLGYLTRTSP